MHHIVKSVESKHSYKIHKDDLKTCCFLLVFPPPPPLKYLKSFKTLIRGINSHVDGDFDEPDGVGLLGVK